MKNFYVIALFLLIGNFGFGQIVVDDGFEGRSVLNPWGQNSPNTWLNSTTDPITGLRSAKHNVAGSGNSYLGINTSSIDLTFQDVSWQFQLKNTS